MDEVASCIRSARDPGPIWALRLSVRPVAWHDVLHRMQLKDEVTGYQTPAQYFAFQPLPNAPSFLNILSNSEEYYIESQQPSYGHFLKVGISFIFMTPLNQIFLVIWTTTERVILRNLLVSMAATSHSLQAAGCDRFSARRYPDGDHFRATGGSRSNPLPYSNHPGRTRNIDIQH